MRLWILFCIFLVILMYGVLPDTQSTFKCVLIFLAAFVLAVVVNLIIHKIPVNGNGGEQ